MEFPILPWSQAKNFRGSANQFDLLGHQKKEADVKMTSVFSSSRSRELEGQTCGSQGGKLVCALVGFKGSVSKWERPKMAVAWGGEGFWEVLLRGGH